MPEISQSATEQQLRTIQRLLAEQPGADYDLVRNSLQQARALFHELLAERLTAALNVHVATRPTATLAERQSLVMEINASLRDLGLAIRRPETGEPCVLHARSGGGDGLQVELIDSEPRRHRTRLELNEPLKLMGFPVRGTPNRARRPVFDPDETPPEIG